jgi:ankyrin repeat protein
MRSKGLCIPAIGAALILHLALPLHSQAFLEAIRGGDLGQVKALLAQNPELLETRLGGTFPLHWAVRAGHKPIVAFLLREKADADRFAKKITEFAPLEFSPITEAIRNNRLDMIKLLVEHGADPSKTTSLGESYLHFAAFLNKPDMIDYFIEAGLDVDIRKNGGLTPLHLAAVTGHGDVAERLIAKGADCRARTDDGGTPLHYAEAAGQSDMADLLRAQGAEDLPRNFPVYRGKYLGVPKPGPTPLPFAPELFRDIYRVHSTPAFSPDGKEVFWECTFMQGNNEASRVWFMKEEDGRWTAPAVAPFAKYPSGGPAFFHDGNTLVYHSMRPREKSREPAKDLDLWIVKREGGGWSEPGHLDTPLNQNGTFEVYPLVAGDGTLYLSTGRREGVVKSALKDGKYQPPEIIGDLFDTDVVDDCTAMKHFLLFSDRARKERFEYEIYVSEHLQDGRWSTPVSLSERLHPGRRASMAALTIDGGYLFFVSYFYFYWVDAGVLRSDFR